MKKLTKEQWEKQLWHLGYSHEDIKRMKDDKWAVLIALLIALPIVIVFIIELI